LPSKQLAQSVLIYLHKPLDRLILYQKYLLNYQGSDVFVLQFCQETAFEMALADPNYWQQALATIANSYAKGVILQSRYFRRIPTERESLPAQVAEETAKHPEKYPRILLPSAEEALRKVVAQNIIAVGEIAKDRHWFEE